MHSSEKDAVARAHRASAEHIRRASDSNADSAAHVRHSKAAIERSLELLRRPFSR